MPKAARQRPGRPGQQERPTANERGYNYEWRVASKAFLRRNPLCHTCLVRGRLVPATVVDHLVPHLMDHDRFWNESNWRAKCKRCHDIKTATEDGGFGYARKKTHSNGS